MGDVAAIVTAKEIITLAELSEVVTFVGGKMYEDIGSLNDINAQAYVNVAVDMSIPSVIEEMHPQQLQEITSVIGGIPKASLSLDFNSEPASYRMVIAFAYHCTAIWKCGLYTLDVHFHFFDREELFRLQKENVSFLDRS